jgi:hypothetical protein
MLVILDNTMLCKEEIIMECYVGLKLVKAEPCTVKEYNETVRPLMYTGECQDGYKIEYEDNYISWSPKEVFEKAYRKTINLTFGLALEELKRGKKVARKGWNGKGQYIELATNISYKNSKKEEINAEHKDIVNKAIAFIVTSGVQLGWLASQADMLAEDWEVIE